MMFKKNKMGQSLLEYSVLIGIVAMALAVMGTAMKRSVQAVVKITADQLAFQNAAEEDADETEAHLINMYTISRTQAGKIVREINPALEDGSIEYRYGMDGDGTGPFQTNSQTVTFLNMGFTNLQEYLVVPSY